MSSSFFRIVSSSDGSKASRAFACCKLWGNCASQFGMFCFMTLRRLRREGAPQKIYISLLIPVADTCEGYAIRGLSLTEEISDGEFPRVRLSCDVVFGLFITL